MANQRSYRTPDKRYAVFYGNFDGAEYRSLQAHVSPVARTALSF